nr:hypothetical protein [uncultured Anaerotignum sp.]
MKKKRKRVRLFFTKKGRALQRGGLEKRAVFRKAVFRKIPFMLLRKMIIFAKAADEALLRRQKGIIVSIYRSACGGSLRVHLAQTRKGGRKNEQQQ